jgi:hypothetical protein
MGDEVHVRVAQARLQNGPFGPAPDASDSGVRTSE